MNSYVSLPEDHVGKTMPLAPPMTGNGGHIPPIKMVMTGGWFRNADRWTAW
jgi:hypothetical protein